MLRAAPEQPANMRLTGLRGVGKTVLLHEFEERAARQGWATAFIELGPSQNTDEGLAAAVSSMVDRIRLELSRAERLKTAVGKTLKGTGTFSLGWQDFKLSVDPTLGGPRSSEITKSLFDVCKLAVEKGKTGVVLLFDEAQSVRDDKSRSGEHPLSLLISSVVALQKQELPLGLVLCGLPTLTGNLLKARSYTERMFRAEQIGSLDEEEARQALLEPIKDGSPRIDDSVVQRTIKEVEGYPYFVQLWGAELWDAAVFASTTEITQAIFDATTPDIYRRLDVEFYDPRISTLTPAEQDLLLATASVQSYPPLLVSEIKEASDKSPGNINVLLGRMVESGVIYRLRQGRYDYTAPKFREYLLRRVKKSQWHP